MFTFSSRSLAKLKGVHPDLVAVAVRAIELSEVDFGITEGVRSKERQKELVAAGKSWTMKSRHLSGKAIDVVAYVGSEISWDLPLYDRIAKAFDKASAELDVPIVWGGKWKARDAVHFELDSRSYP